MLADWLTVEDTVFSNFTYVEPLHSREWALRFTQLWISHLKEYGVTPLEEGTDPDLLERLHG